MLFFINARKLAFAGVGAMALAAAPVTVSGADRTIVLLNGSNGAGWGATTYDSAYAGRYAAYLTGLKPAWSLVNLSVAGYTTYNIMPTGYNTPAGRSKVDTSHNITKVLALKPACFILCMLGNDIAYGYSETEIKNNLDSLYRWATRAGIKTWVVNAPPRNTDSPAQTEVRLSLNAWILSHFAGRAIDYYDGLGVNGKFYPEMHNGDGIHYSNRGHAHVFRTIVAANLPGVPTVSFLGASSTLGFGASTPDSSYISRYEKYLSGLNPTWRVENLSIVGHTTYDIMPTGYKPPAGRTAPDSAHNITKVLAQKPQSLLINMTGSDITNGFTEAEIKANLDSLYTWGTKAGVKVWVANAPPRNLDDSAQRIRRKNLNTWILSRFAPRVLDLHDSLGGADGSMYPSVNSGDGNHFNNRGQEIVYKRLVAANLPGLVVDIRSAPSQRSSRPAHAPRLKLDQTTGSLLLPGPDRARFDVQGRKARRFRAGAARR